MAFRPRYQFSFPYYRPETPDDHYRNNVFLERAFNLLPLPKTRNVKAFDYQINMAVGTEVDNVSISVNAELDEDFMIFFSGIVGQHSTAGLTSPGTVGGRVILTLYAYYEGTENSLQRMTDWTNPSTTNNFTKSSTVAYFKSPINGVVRFYTKVSYLNAGYGMINASVSTPIEMTVQSFGID